MTCADTLYIICYILRIKLVKCVQNLQQLGHYSDDTTTEKEVGKSACLSNCRISTILCILLFCTKLYLFLYLKFEEPTYTNEMLEKGQKCPYADKQNEVHAYSNPVKYAGS